MPVTKIISKKDKEIVAECHCDFCGNFYGFADQKWMEYSGYDIGRPKFSIKCTECNKHEWDCGFKIGCLIRGYGRVPMITILENERNRVMSNVRTKKSENAVIQWTSMDELITKGNCKLKNVAQEMNINALDLKQEFVTHYGDKIVFKRGRNGGVFWANQVEVASTPEIADENI